MKVPFIPMCGLWENGAHMMLLFYMFKYTLVFVIGTVYTSIGNKLELKFL